MNRNELFKSIGGISDEFISEAENASRGARFDRAKIAIIAAAAAAVMGITAFAGTIITGISSHSSNIPDYREVPSAKTLKNDIGIAPNLPEEFSGGYKFAGGHIVRHEDPSGGEIGMGISSEYARGGDKINVDADAVDFGAFDGADAAEVYKDCEIVYYAYMNKLVPPDYELTEQDRADEESGKLVFSYGSDSVRISEVKCLSFCRGGLNYSFTAIDSPVTKEELMQMARELIDIN